MGSGVTARPSSPPPADGLEVCVAGQPTVDPVFCSVSCPVVACSGVSTLRSFVPWDSELGKKLYKQIKGADRKDAERAQVCGSDPRSLWLGNSRLGRGGSGVHRGVDRSLTAVSRHMWRSIQRFWCRRWSLMSQVCGLPVNPFIGSLVCVVWCVCRERVAGWVGR